MDIWQQIYDYIPADEVVRSRVVCKEFDEVLRLSIKKIHIRNPIAQSSLESLAKTYPNLAMLRLSPKGYETEPLDWEKVHLPRLQHLCLSCCPLLSIVFTVANTPSLISLSIEDQKPAAKRFNVALPELTHMEIYNAQVTLVPAPPRLYTACRPDMPCKEGPASDHGCMTTVLALTQTLISVLLTEEGATF